MKKNRWIYPAVCIGLTALTLAFLLLTVLSSAGVQVEFHGGFVTVLLSFGGVLTLGSLFTRRVSGNRIKKAGFYLMHAGVVLLLGGFALFSLFGDTVTAVVPVNGGSYYSQIQRQTGEIRDLGLNFRVDSVEVEHYADGSVKQYHAVLSFTDEITLRTEEKALSVNRTVRQGGWKFYLMRMDPDAATVTLTLRRDPGEFAVKAGAWMLIVGCVCSLVLGNMGGKKDE